MRKTAEISMLSFNIYLCPSSLGSVIVYIIDTLDNESYLTNFALNNFKASKLSNTFG